MSNSSNIYELPEDLPIPVDDGACDHLTGLRLPDMALMSTVGTAVNLAKLTGRTVVYCYPRTGRPDQAIPTGWDLIAGARGCTPQSCAFRDHYQEIQSLHADVYGLSTQDSAYQQEAMLRLRLPFPLLSDAELEYVKALRLPTFTVEGMTLIKRVTLIVEDGVIIKVFYPVFPPDQDAANVIEWLGNGFLKEKAYGVSP
jgi:peroxiredoxin